MRETTLCYISSGESVLMLHRIKKKNDPNQNKWIGIGGGIEPGETPEQCLLREVHEETGLTLTRYEKRGVIDFVSESWEDECMHLYTADGYDGELTICDEGDLHWVQKDRILSLPLWEGDRIFLRLLAEGAPFFHLRLEYDATEALARAVLNGEEIQA